MELGGVSHEKPTTQGIRERQTGFGSEDTPDPGPFLSNYGAAGRLVYTTSRYCVHNGTLAGTKSQANANTVNHNLTPLVF